jgi:hypothetical protein
MNRRLRAWTAVVALGLAVCVAAVPLTATASNTTHPCPGAIVHGSYSHIEATRMSCHAAKHGLHHARTHFIFHHRRLQIIVHIRGYHCVHIGNVNYRPRYRCGRNIAPRHHYFRFAISRI